MKKIIIREDQFKELFADEIKQIERNENYVLFSYDNDILRVTRINEEGYPPEAHEAWLEWVDVEKNPRTMIGSILFVLFYDFYIYNDKAKKIVTNLFLQRKRYKEEKALNEVLDKKWGMPLKNALLSWVDDYIDEYWWEFPEFVKEEAKRDWDFTDEECEDAFQEYKSLSKDEMLKQINWNKEERHNFAMWLYERHSRFDNDDSDDEEDAYELKPIEGLGDTFKYIRDINNEWVIHFGTDAIASQGFNHSAYDIDDLRATTDLKTKFGKEGYNFGYLALDNSTYFKSFWSYGGNFASAQATAVLFKANGIAIYHKGDNEEQVIFPSNTVKDIIPLYNNHGEWYVKSCLTGKILHKEPLSDEIQDKYDVTYWLPNGRKGVERRGINTSFKSEHNEWAASNLQLLVKWITNNFIQYRKHLVINDRINSLNENYLYHVSRYKDFDINNLKPYRSENRWQKWAGSGHETGSFGSGTYFTDETPRDGNLSGHENDIRNAKYDARFYNEHLVEIGKNLYRVDTDFYKNMYVLKSEKEGDLLKELMAAIDSFVRNCEYDASSFKATRIRQQRWLKIQKISNTLGLRIPWTYKEFLEFAYNYCKDESIVQTPATIFMEKNGFNGVDASMAGKYNSYWEGSVIYDLSKVERNISPELGPRDEFNIKYGADDRTMEGDIVLGKSKPSYFKTGEYTDRKDNPQELLKALKRYDMVLDAHHFWSLPDVVKKEYLNILLKNIRGKYITTNDGYSWFRSDTLRELTDDIYIENIIKFEVVGFMNIHKSLTRNILNELAWGRADKNVVIKFLNAYQGDLNDFDAYQEIKEEYNI